MSEHFIDWNSEKAKKAIERLLGDIIKEEQKEKELISLYREYLFDNPCNNELQSIATAVGIELAIRTLGLEIEGINK